MNFSKLSVQMKSLPNHHFSFIFSLEKSKLIYAK
jgi:hypothetical protein